MNTNKMKEGEKEGIVMRDAITINVISQAEMKAHIKEMRSEMDRKLVGILMVQGMSRLEANERVAKWNSQLGVC